eukprot:Seg1762.1 transcript_id=Seg1762.1/GoldUCD/mRNA.D3Y31 product="hypothetical protein" protein_id=Seg1762.1/GoldUCD/D3Y31
MQRFMVAIFLVKTLAIAQGVAKPDLHWKLDQGTSDGYVKEENSTDQNRGYLLHGTRILRTETWITAYFNGNKSGIIFDNITNECILSPQSCKAGLSISFHIRWQNWTNVRDGSIISSGNFSVHHTSGDRLVVSLWDGTNELQIVHARNLTRSGWACYIVTWDRNSLRLYINGSLMGEVSPVTTIATTATTTASTVENGIYSKRSNYSLGSSAVERRIAFGNTAQRKVNKKGIKMFMDDVKIWDYVLKANETGYACYREKFGGGGGETGGGEKVGQDPYIYENQAFSTIDYANKALIGHVFETHLVNSLKECTMKCMQNKVQCHSFNIGRTTTKSLICELNKVSKEKYAHRIKERKDFYHYEVYFKV